MLMSLNLVSVESGELAPFLPLRPHWGAHSVCHVVSSSHIHNANKWWKTTFMQALFASLLPLTAVTSFVGKHPIRVGKKFFFFNNLSFSSWGKKHVNWWGKKNKFSMLSLAMKIFRGGGEKFLFSCWCRACDRTVHDAEVLWAGRRGRTKQYFSYFYLLHIWMFMFP